MRRNTQTPTPTVTKNPRPPIVPPTMEIAFDDPWDRLFCVPPSVGGPGEMIEVGRSEPVELSGSSELVQGTAVFGWLWFDSPLPRIVMVDTFLDLEGTKFVELSGRETVEGRGVHLSGLSQASLATAGLKLSPS